MSRRVVYLLLLVWNTYHRQQLWEASCGGLRSASEFRLPTAPGVAAGTVRQWSGGLERKKAVELHQIVAFQKTSQERSITRAAAQLYITQPALSAKIRALEMELGRQLFIRRGHGVELTDAGRAFLVYAERVLTLLQDGFDAVRAIDPSTGTLSVGAIYSTTLSFLPRAVTEFSRQYPGVAVSIHAGNSSAVFDLVLARTVKIGLIARDFAAKGIEREVIGTDPIVLVAAPQHPLANDRVVGVESLRGYRLIMAPWGSGYAEFADEISARLGLGGTAPRINMDPTHAALRLTELGVGLCFLPLTVVADALRQGTVIPLHVKDLPPLERQIVGVFAAHEHGAALIPSLVDASRQAMRDLIVDLPQPSAS